MGCEFKGGARFGHANATWPLARLTANESELVIRASLLGEHRFEPADVVEVRPVRWFPLFAQGVQIIHTCDDRPERIIFWTLGSPARICEAIRSSGFRGTASAADVPEPLGFPLRWPFAIVMILCWNGAILLDRPWDPPRIGGPGMLTAVSLLLVVSVAVRFPGPLQRLALKEPRALSRIRSVLDIATVVAAFMLVALIAENLSR